MKKLFAPLLLIASLTLSCAKEELPKDEKEITDPKEPTEDLQVEQFIYEVMEDIYLYEAEVPELQDDYFKSEAALDDYLGSFESPFDLYEDLQAVHDKFSFMTDDYVALEKMFNGVTKSNGMDFGLAYMSSDSDKVIGYVNYVVKGSSAEEQGIERGDVFTKVNGTQLTSGNYVDLLYSGATYTINKGRLVNGEVVWSDQEVSLTGEELSEDPVHVSKVLETEGREIGYLMYNGFFGTPEFDTKLNAAFGDFKAQGVTDLILDLRYNSGGHVMTAIDLAGMITGQFEDEVLIKVRYNDKYQSLYSPESYLVRFDSKIQTGEALNSLNLNRVFVITSSRSASASELVINGLEPYINVVQIGENTAGKFQVSNTFYDSPDGGREGASTEHTYAVQPLIAKYANAEGKTDFFDGLVPDIAIEEHPANLGILGDPSERLLQAALNAALGKSQETMATSKQMENQFKVIGNSEMFKPSYQRMILGDGPILQLKD